MLSVSSQSPFRRWTSSGGDSTKGNVTCCLKSDLAPESYWGCDVAEEKETVESLEQQVFKALDHQTRRDIIRVIGEGKNIIFTEIMVTAKAPDSPTLSYHLRSLAPFVEQKGGRYNLTTLGRSAYGLLLRTNTYNTQELL